MLSEYKILNWCEFYADIFNWFNFFGNDWTSDGLVRVFTKAAERVAAEDLIKCLEQEVAATALSAQLELGGIKASE